MKKKYISPTIDFEFLEEEDMLMVSQPEPTGRSSYDLGEENAEGYNGNEEKGPIDVAGNDFWIE